MALIIQSESPKRHNIAVAYFNVVANNNAVGNALNLAVPLLFAANLKRVLPNADTSLKTLYFRYTRLHIIR